MELTVTSPFANPNNSEILNGCKPESESYYALNHYPLIAKYHIFLKRKQSESPSLKNFLALLENEIKCERQVDHALHLQCVKYFSISIFFVLVYCQPYFPCSNDENSGIIFLYFLSSFFSIYCFCIV